MNTQHALDLIDILRGQYTRNNDGGGLHGTCRVDNNALLELCRMTEELIKQRDELMTMLEAERKERKAVIDDALVCKVDALEQQSAELLAALKYAYEYMPISVDIRRRVYQAIAKAGG